MNKGDRHDDRQRVHHFTDDYTACLLDVQGNKKKERSDADSRLHAVFASVISVMSFINDVEVLLQIEAIYMILA